MPDSLSESDFKTGKVHSAHCLVHAVQFISWHLAIEGHARPQGPLSPPLCGTGHAKLSIQISLVNWVL